MDRTFDGGALPQFLARFIRNGPSPRVRENLKNFGSIPIVKVSICRRPLARALVLAANALTGNAIQHTIEQQGFDTLFHLYALLTLANGANLLVEKNEVVNLELIQPPSDKKHVCISVPMPPGGFGTINSLFATGHAVQGNRFWLYEARTNNCQLFILALFGQFLTEKDRKFILQDVSYALQHDSLLTRVASTLTDTAALAHRIIFGKGYKRRAPHGRHRVPLPRRGGARQ